MHIFFFIVYLVLVFFRFGNWLFQLDSFIEFYIKLLILLHTYKIQIVHFIFSSWFPDKMINKC